MDPSLFRNVQKPVIQPIDIIVPVCRGLDETRRCTESVLNSDTEVASDWVDRLRACAYREPDIGTVTPFSNNAAICSWPRFYEDNDLPAGWDVARLNVLFQDANAGFFLDIPTAVGFCMYIHRACLDKVDSFDAARFGRGYGEENDFCMRATAADFRQQVPG